MVKKIKELTIPKQENFGTETTNSLVDYEANESNGSVLTGRQLVQTQGALGIKINEIIAALGDVAAASDFIALDNTMRVQLQPDGKIAIGTKIFVDFLSNTGDKIPFNFSNIVVEGTEGEVLDDNAEVRLLTIGRIKGLFNELNNISNDYNAVYELIDESLDLVPTQEQLNAIYNSYGIEVKTLVDLRASDNSIVAYAGQKVFLVSTLPSGDEAEAGRIYWTGVKPGEAITIVTADTSEPASYTSNGWVVSTLKNEMKNAYNEFKTMRDTFNATKQDVKISVAYSTGTLDTTVSAAIQKNANDINTNASGIASVQNLKADKTAVSALETKLNSDIATNKGLIGDDTQGKFLTVQNSKDVAGGLDIKYDGIVDATPDRIATRRKVAQMGAALKQLIDAAQTKAEEGVTDAATAQAKADQTAHDLDATKQTVSQLGTDLTQLHTTGTEYIGRVQALEVAIADKANAQDVTDEANARDAEDKRLSGAISTLTGKLNSSLADKADQADLVTEVQERIVSETTIKTSIADNKTAIANLKTQTDADRADVATVKTDLTTIENKANAALLYGEDWNQGKQSLVRKDELTTATLWGGSDNAGQAQIRGLHLIAASSTASNKTFKVALTGATVSPAIDWTGIPDGCKAIANFIRTVPVSGGDPINLWNDTTDTHFNDSSAIASPDTFYVFNTADTTDVSARIGIPVNVEINKQAILITFNPLGQNNQPIDLTSAQIANIDAYTLHSLEFIGQGSAQVAGNDVQARQDITTLAGRVTTVEAKVNTKQDKLTAQQLGVLGGEVFTTALKTNYDTAVNTANTALTKANAAATPDMIGYTSLLGKSGADIYNSMTQGKGYIIPLPANFGADKFSGICSYKDARGAWSSGLGTDGYGRNYHLLIMIKPDGTIIKDTLSTDIQRPAGWVDNTYMPTAVGYPISDWDASTKKYVDTQVANATPADYTGTKNRVTHLEDVTVYESDITHSTVKTLQSVTNPLVAKSYVNSKLAAKQDATFATGTTIAGASTVEGALKAIDAKADLAKAEAEAIDLSTKQNKTDNTLATDDKTVVGAINGLHSDVQTINQKISLDDTHLKELETLLGIPLPTAPSSPVEIKKEV